MLLATSLFTSWPAPKPSPKAKKGRGFGRKTGGHLVAAIIKDVDEKMATND